MLNTIIIVAIILVFVYFVAFPERAPAIFKREPKTATQGQDDSESEDESDGGQCKPSGKLVKQRNTLIADLNRPK